MDCNAKPHPVAVLRVLWGRGLIRKALLVYKGGIGILVRTLAHESLGKCAGDQRDVGCGSTLFFHSQRGVPYGFDGV